MTFELAPRWTWRLRLCFALGAVLLTSAAWSQVSLNELTSAISAAQHAVTAPNTDDRVGTSVSPQNTDLGPKNEMSTNWSSGTAQPPADRSLNGIVKPGATAKRADETFPSTLGLPEHAEENRSERSGSTVPQWASSVAIGFLGAGGVALLGWRLRRQDVRRARL